jgi:ATP-dependent RNA helicase MRH4
VADQLKEVVKKFNEVDQWELEFEEVVDSSSPNGGR